MCLASFLCLLLTFLWFRVRFNAQVLFAEITALLCCVIFFGWLLPIGASVFSVVVLRARFSITVRHDGQQSPKNVSLSQLYPPRYQSGVMPPFVFSAETPWGWLEYRSGNFQGQQLALKRSIITLGRAEDCDIWLDDDIASRRHAEVAWENNIAYLTDCESLNSTRLNGRRVRGSVLLSSGDIIEIGAYRFLFILVEQKMVTSDQYDPLVNHKWRSSSELQDLRETTQHSFPLPAAKPLLDTDEINTKLGGQQVESDLSALQGSGEQAPSSQTVIPAKTPLRNGPMLLRLPSRQKEL